MDVAKILSELKEERVQIEEAILSLERLARGRGKRRGRPPAWMSEINAKRRGRPPGSKNKVAVEAAGAPAKTIARINHRCISPSQTSLHASCSAHRIFRLPHPRFLRVGYRRGYRVWGASPRRTFTFLERPPR